MLNPEDFYTAIYSIQGLCIVALRTRQPLSARLGFNRLFSCELWIVAYL